MDELLHESPSLRLHVCADARLISSSHAARLRTGLCMFAFEFAFAWVDSAFPERGQSVVSAEASEKDPRTSDVSAGLSLGPSSSDLCTVSVALSYFFSRNFHSRRRPLLRHDVLCDPT